MSPRIYPFPRFSFREKYRFLQFLFSAYLRMFIDISPKFRENILYCVIYKADENDRVLTN